MLDTALVERLVASQFPHWRSLTITPIFPGGWDHRTFRLGEELLIRLPSSAEYASQVEKEHLWLPKLSPFLPLTIPKSLHVGAPGEGYPWKWGIYRWIEGEAANTAPIEDPSDVARALAQFLLALERVDPKEGPLPGIQNFYRGGSLAVYDKQTRLALAALKGKIDTQAATELWESALATRWDSPAVWVHGDISPGNLLIKEGKLDSVIDFGLLSIGDPACDLSIAWTFFHGESREVFQTLLPYDSEIWTRARAWTLWKALITAASHTKTNATESKNPKKLIEELL